MLHQAQLSPQSKYYSNAATFIQTKKKKFKNCEKNEKNNTKQQTSIVDEVAFNAAS